MTKSYRPTPTAEQELPTRAGSSGPDPWSSNALGMDTLGSLFGGDSDSGTPMLDAAGAKNNDSARFEGDRSLARIGTGLGRVGKGGRGLTVTKLQQALVDLGYLLPKYGVDGKFEGETRAAVLKFQDDHTLLPTGEFDAATIDELNLLFETRKPYVDNATFDPMNPGTRALSAKDKTAVEKAMVPTPGGGAVPAKFQEVVNGEKYGDRIREHLKAEIASLHKDLFDDKVGLRADPAKNFHDWSTLEGPAAAAKQVTDLMYGSYNSGPAMTHAGGNLIDQWEDELQLNSKLDADPLQDTAEKWSKARGKVVYLVNSNCETINQEHSAVPSGTKEAVILKPIIDAMVDSDAKIQTMLDLETGWEGAQLDGVVFLQRYKSTNTDVDDAKEENRVQMWELFHTCIHEYLHTLADPAFHTWAGGKDETRENTLVEGFCDFFTLNVRSTLNPDATLQALIEGPYGNGGGIPTISSGVYPSHAQAEQVVSIVGIRNAQAAYFQGDISRMGGS